uniref:Uncharacterized protein n=1 Tax=Peronospora matthiolae TaxID=2874970 RepID=A0AAV1TRU2_9STRA
MEVAEVQEALKTLSTRESSNVEEEKDALHDHVDRCVPESFFDRVTCKGYATIARA